MKKKITMKPNLKGKKVGKELLLSLQHMFAMFGATVTVPMITGMDISLALISAGIGTILFYLLTKRKVPVFLGSSFAFLPGILAAGYDKGAGNKLAVTIALVCAGLVYVIFAIIIKLVGADKIKKLFPPIVVGPVIVVIGLTLAGNIFLNNIWNPAEATEVLLYGKRLVKGSAGFQGWRYWTTAIITAIVIVVTNAYAKPKSFLKVIPILLGFAVGYVYAMAVGIVNLNPYSKEFIFHKTQDKSIVVFQEIFKSGGEGILGFYVKGWGQLKNGTLATAMLSIVPIAVVTFMEHIGDISANSVVCKKDFMVDPGLHRTVLGDGIATMVSGLIGGPANTTYGENTAVLAITKNYNPRNIFYAALMAVGLGIFTPFAEFIKGIPGPVVGGASVILFGMIAANGLRALVDAKVNFSSTKNMMVVSITLALGLGLGSLSLMGKKIGFHVKGGGLVEISPLAIATLAAIILNLIIPSKRGKTQEEIESTDKPMYSLAGKVIDEEKNIDELPAPEESENAEGTEKLEQKEEMLTIAQDTEQNEEEITLTDNTNEESEKVEETEIKQEEIETKENIIVEKKTKKKTVKGAKKNEEIR